VAHGNEDTFREMLRIRRSVAASFSQTHFNTAGVAVADAPGPATGAHVASKASQDAARRVRQGSAVLGRTRCAVRAHCVCR
jgi:pre-mRNA-splicing factor SYF1